MGGPGVNTNMTERFFGFGMKLSLDKEEPVMLISVDGLTLELQKDGGYILTGPMADILKEPMYPSSGFPNHIGRWPSIEPQDKAWDWEPFADYSKIRDFINGRLGYELLPAEVDEIPEDTDKGIKVFLSFEDYEKSNSLIKADVLRGTKGNGEIKISINRTNESTGFGLSSKTTTDVNNIVISADGNIYLENDGQERKPIATISHEDAAGLIAALYGKEELGDIPAPSELHVKGIKTLLGIETFKIGPTVNYPVHFGRNKIMDMANPLEVGLPFTW